MSVPISWLLSQQSLGLSLVAGPARPRRQIQFAQATELRDPSPWLSGGELVLTTGLDYDGDSTGYIERLHSAGVAALGFGTGLSHERIPRDLVVAADAVGLALLEVPRATPFAAVTKAVMSRLAEQDYEQVIRAAAVQTKITRAALRGGIDGLVRELSIATGRSVVFVGSGSESYYPPSETLLATDARALAATHSTRSATSITVSSSDRALAMQPVSVGHSHHGYLAIAGSTTIGNIDRILFGHAVSLLALELEKPTVLRTEQSRLNSIATGLLLDGHFESSPVPAYLRDAADATDAIRVLTVRSGDNSNVSRYIDAALREQGRAVYANVDDAGLRVVLRGSDSKDLVVELLREVPVKEGKHCRSGLSLPSPLSQAPRAAYQAKIAVGLANSQSRLVEYNQRIGSALVASESSRAVLEDVATSAFTPLAEQEIGSHDNLIGSLRAYLEANGQWESAASLLGIHRHTLRNRIRRIEVLLDCDLTQARVRAELLLALVVRESAIT